MLLLLIITISHIRTSQCVRATPGHPVPHADILDDLLSKFLGDSYSNSALFNFILGEPNQDTEANISPGDNLDISILDVDSVRKIIDFAKKKHDHEIQAAENSRRQGNEVYEINHPYIINKTIDLMKHTIYMTQEKVNYTRMYRKIYSGDPAYQIALLYGAAAAMLGKMESLIAQQNHLTKGTHFIWFLILYEKILACNVDINNAVEKLFKIQEVDEKARGGKKPMGSKSNLTAADLKALLQDPVALEKYKRDHALQSRRSGRREGRN